MSDERIMLKKNSGDIIFVAPHGHLLDDTNTDVMTEAAANHIGASAVINKGWRRNSSPNMAAGVANCNDIRHCQQAPLCQEFLEPIKAEIQVRLAAGRKPMVVLMHGMGNAVRQQADGVEAVVGYGNGNPPRMTCQVWQKDMFVDGLIGKGLITYEGAPGGKYSAHNVHNLAQALKSFQQPVECIQIEIVAHRRSGESLAAATGILIAEAIDKVTRSNGYTRTAPFNAYL